MDINCGGRFLEQRVLHCSGPKGRCTEVSLSILGRMGNMLSVSCFEISLKLCVNQHASKVKNFLGNVLEDSSFVILEKTMRVCSTIVRASYFFTRWNVQDDIKFRRNISSVAHEIRAKGFFHEITGRSK